MEKAIIEVAVQAEAWREYSEFSANNADSLKVLVDEHSVEVRALSDELLAESTKKVYDSCKTFHDKAIAWAKLSEQGYLNARSLDT